MAGQRRVELDPKAPPAGLRTIALEIQNRRDNNVTCIAGQRHRRLVEEIRTNRITIGTETTWNTATRSLSKPKHRYGD